MVTTEQVRQQYFDGFSAQISDHLKPLLFVEFDYEQIVSEVREWNFTVGISSSDEHQVKLGFVVRPDGPLNDMRMVTAVAPLLERAWTKHNSALPTQIDT